MKPQGTAMLLLTSIPHPLPAQSGEGNHRAARWQLLLLQSSSSLPKIKGNISVGNFLKWEQCSSTSSLFFFHSCLSLSLHCRPPSPTLEKRVVWLFPFQLCWGQVATHFILRVLLPSSQADSKERQCKRILCCTFTLKWESSLGLEMIQLKYGQKHLWRALLVVQTLKPSFRLLKYIVIFQDRCLPKK